MAEDKRLTVGELRAALVGVPDDQEVSFLSDEDDTLINLNELVVDGDVAYFNVAVTSPLLDVMRSLEDDLGDMLRVAAWMRQEAPSLERKLAAMLKQLEDRRDRISRGFED